MLGTGTQQSQGISKSHLKERGTNKEYEIVDSSVKVKTHRGMCVHAEERVVRQRDLRFNGPNSWVAPHQERRPFTTTKQVRARFVFITLNTGLTLLTGRKILLASL